MPCNSTCPSQGPNSAAWARHRSDATLRAMSTMLLQANPPSHPALWADGGSSDTHALDILNRCIFLIGFRELEQSPFFPPHTTSSNLLDQKNELSERGSILTEIEKLLHGERWRRKFREMFDVFGHTGQGGIFHDEPDELHYCCGGSGLVFMTTTSDVEPVIMPLTQHGGRDKRKSSELQPIERRDFFYLHSRLANRSRRGGRD